MGRKRSWTWQCLHFCTAGLILIMIAACAPLGSTPAEKKNTQPRQSPQLVVNGDFAGALRKNEEILALSPHRPPGDTALFNLGMIHVHYANPKRDPGRALQYFKRLTEEFPESAQIDEARNWVHILRALEQPTLHIIEVEETKKELPIEQGNTDLRRGQQLLADGDFAGALQANREVLALHPHDPPGDEALYTMGLIHIHYANPKKDIGRAQALFARIAKEFPGSPRIEEAKIWVDILETMKKTREIDIEIEEKKRELRGET